ncbi:MAG: M24 family metallopeptidase, partial [Myxococcaceae bacterium]
MPVLRFSRLVLVAFLLAASLALAAPPKGQPPAADRTALPGWSEQIRIREEWLTRRHALLLDMMRRHGVAMWIVVNE